MRVLAQPKTTTPTAPVNSAAPTPTVATTSTPASVTRSRSTANSILVMVYKLATRQFAEVPCQTTRPKNKGPNPQPLEDILSAPVRQNTPWPNAGSASENLFETRKDWPIPPTTVATPTPTIKTEEPPQVAAIPCNMLMPKQAAEKFSWGLHCPICKNEEEHKEDWDGNMQNQPRMPSQNIQHPQPQNSQQSFDIPNR